MQKLTLSVVMFCIFCFFAITANATLSEGVLRIGISKYYQPYTFVDSQGFAQGFSVSFMQSICNQQKWTCIYRPMFYPDLFKALQDGQIDAAIGAFAVTPEREQYFNFTVPYLPSVASFVSMAENGKPKITDISQASLRGKTIGMLSGEYYAAYLEREYSNIKFKYYPDNSTMVGALRNHDIDLIITDTPSALIWLNRSGGHLAIIGHPISFNFGIAIMLNENNLELLNQLNPAIIEYTKTAQFKFLIETYFQGYYMNALEHSDIFRS